MIMPHRIFTSVMAVKKRSSVLTYDNFAGAPFTPRIGSRGRVGVTASIGIGGKLGSGEGSGTFESYRTLGVKIC